MTTTHWNLATSSLNQEMPNQEEGLTNVPEPHKQEAPPSFGSSESQLSKSFTFPSQKPDPFSRLYNGRSSVSNDRQTHDNTTQEDSRLSRSINRNPSISQEREPRGASNNALSNSNSRANLSRRDTPARPVSAKPADISRSKSPPRFSEKAVIRQQKAKIAHNEGLRLGTEGFDALIHRKTLEKQVEILENRLNKLKAEENVMSKKIKDTTSKTENILTSKRRRQDELVMRDLRNKKREEDLNRKKMELLREREENRNNLKKSKLYNFKNKHDVAYTMKVDNAYHKALKDDFKRRREERNKELISKVQGVSNLSMSIRQCKDLSKKDDVNHKYADRVEKDKEKADLLAAKCKELERQEHQMLEKLSQTYNLHKEKIVELEKAFTMRVQPYEE